jgi:hypothetical protein
MEVQLPAILTLVIDESEWSASHLNRLIPEERAHGTYWITSRVCLRTGLETAKM